jgi:hypothetical protein
MKQVIILFMVVVALIVGNTVERHLTWASAKLPDELIAQSRKIKDMKVGDVGYASPYALMVDDENNCYLNGRLELEKPPIYVVGNIKVERKAEGYIVYIKKGSNFYTPSRIYDKDRMIKERELIPIKEIIVVKDWSAS